MEDVIDEGLEQPIDEISLRSFLEAFEEDLTNKVTSKLRPVFDPRKVDEWDEKANARLDAISLRTPFLAQRHLILAARKLLLTDKAALVSGEMGTGKTLQAILIAAMDPIPRRHIVICPPHLVAKWVAEVGKTIPEDIGISFNFNGKDAVEKLRQLPRRAKPKVHEFYVMSRERAKGSYMWKHISLPQRVVEASGSVVRKVDYCFKCGAVIDPEQVKMLKSKKNQCPECKEPFWQADETRLRRWAPAEYIKRHMPRGYFETVIADEVHELKGESAQGAAFCMIASRCKRVIPLTGSLLGGYADDIFYILWRAVPRIMQAAAEKHSNKEGWIERYGILEKIYKPEGRDNVSTRSLELKSVKRLPGISPVVLSKFLLPITLFIKLSDISDALPPYEEQMHAIELEGATKDEYQRFEAELEIALDEAMQKRDHTILSRMLQALLSWPDNCRKEEVVYNQDDEDVATAKAIDIDYTNKEQKLIEIVRENLSKRRKTLIYAEYTGTRDIMPTIVDRLESKGVRCLVMRSTVPAEKREAWIKRQMKEQEIDCLLCNPRLVQTGLDLIEFPEIVFFQTGYSIFVLRQASRRSWRIGQTEPVRVHFLCNSGTMQERAMTLIAKKLETALAIEGDLSENGLSDLSDGGGVGSMVLELAKSLVEKANLGGVEAAWSSYRKKEFVAEAYIDDTITETVTVKAESKPEVITIATWKKDKDGNSIIKVGKPVQLTLFD